MYKRQTLIGSDIGLANLEKKMSLAEAGSKFRETIKTLEGQGFDVCLIDTPPSLGVTTVSYTHLDVYKRQGFNHTAISVAAGFTIRPNQQIMCVEINVLRQRQTLVLLRHHLRNTVDQQILVEDRR